MNDRYSNVIKVDELTFTRKYQRDCEKKCQHLHVTLDDNGEIVTCNACGESLSAYWVLRDNAEKFNTAYSSLNSDKQEIDALRKSHVVLKAAKRVEAAWRSKTMVPSCPHCRNGIFPEDGFGGSAIGKDYEIARRKREKEAKL